MKYILKKDIGKLKKGTVLVQHGVVVGTGDSWFGLEMVTNDEKYFQRVDENVSALYSIGVLFASSISLLASILFRRDLV